MQLKHRAGVLCYGLTPATADLLNRVAERLERLGVALKAFPLVSRDVSRLLIHFAYRPTTFAGKFLTVQGHVPDSLLLTMQWGVISDLIRQSDIIVLLGLQSIPALLSVFLARIMGKPVLTINQTMPPVMERKRPWFIRWSKKLMLHMAQLHIVQTEASERTLREIYGIRDDQLVYAPFDGGGQFFKELLKRYPHTDIEATRARFHTPRDAVVFTFVGTLIYLKGVDILLCAFAKVRLSVPDACLWIVGPDGGSKGQLAVLREQAQQLGLSGRVTFTGPQRPEELVAVYRASDAFVLPTRRDMWPKVLVEAALVGLPLITTPASGAAYTLVRDGVNGFVVPINDADALAGAMLHLADPQAQREMGHRSRDIVQESIQPELEADRITEAILRLLRSSC